MGRLTSHLPEQAVPASACLAFGDVLTVLSQAAVIKALYRPIDLRVQSQRLLTAQQFNASTVLLNSAIALYNFEWQTRSRPETLPRNVPPSLSHSLQI